MIVDLPPPERPTSAVVLPGSATKLMSRDAAKFEPPRGDREFGFVGRLALLVGWRENCTARLRLSPVDDAISTLI